MARRRWRRREAPSDMGEALLEALESSGLTDQARRVRISKAWRAAVGETLARRTAPEGFSRGTLIIRTASPAWQNELTFLKGKLIGQINAALGQELVRDIKVVSGRIRDSRPGPPAMAETRPLTQTDKDALADAAQAIGDPEVKRAFERAISSLASHHPEQE